MALYAGVDCGTQSTKVIIVDDESKQIIGQASAKHPIISDSNGKREQLASWWIDALISAFKQAIKDAGIDGRQIVALGVSGQQHGFVPIDKKGNVLVPVKLWCDTETTQENSEIVEKLGGISETLNKIGIAPQTGFTASKILWFKKNHPIEWQQLYKVLLPHDYINYWLTGITVAEYGDASGTGLLDVVNRQWSQEVISKICLDGTLSNAMPNLVEAQTCIGTVRPEIASLLGISETTKVSTGGGDNMMAAIGTGNIREGIITMSLGTSGTLFTYSDKPMKTHNPLLSGFCSSTNGWLPLICTMNVTSATSAIQKLLKLNITEFNEALNRAKSGAGGIVILPFFNGERTPNLPGAKASFHGIDIANLSVENLCLAVVEAATYGLRYGIDIFKRQGVVVNEIRLVGGGSKSSKWRQIVANVMGVSVVSIENEEAPALGAALQAMWCSSAEIMLNKNDENYLQSLCDQFVKLDETTRVEPEIDEVIIYERLYQNYLAVLQNEHQGVEV